MATVKRFEDLTAWKKSRQLTSDVYKAFSNCRDIGFKDQIQRASVSVMSNIAEGFESGTKDLLLNYLYIAKASCGEVRAQLYAAHDIEYINAETFKDLKDQAEQCSKLTASFISKVKQNEYQGLQRKVEQKKDDFLEKQLVQSGTVMTSRGVMKKEEAHKRGLKILKG